MDRRAFPRIASLALVALALGLAPRTGAADWAEAKAAFRKAMQSDDPAARRTALLRLVDQDNAEAVEEIVGVFSKEQDPSVLLAAVRAVGRYSTPPAMNALVAAAKAAKGSKRGLCLLAMRESMGDAGNDFVIELLGSGDPQDAAHAAHICARRRIGNAVPKLLLLLAHKDGFVRGAAARALGMLAAQVPVDKRSALVDALEASQGRERAEILDALKAVTGKELGYDPSAWRLLVDKGAAVVPVPRPTPYVAGIPIYGRRVVLVLDHSICTDDPHPYQDNARLQALLKVPNARDAALWVKVKTTADFIAAHGRRLVNDMPEGSQIGFVSVGGSKVDTKFARLVPANAGSKAAIEKSIEGMKPENGLDALTALFAALDAGGKEPQSWSAGPDEIVYMGCGVPWLAAVKDAGAVAAAVGLRARLRCVTIHTIGVGNHSQEMLRTIADLSGGRYLDLSK